MSPFNRPRVTPPPEAFTVSGMRDLADRLRRLRARALEEEARHADLLAAVDPAHRLSARNLVHYLALRSVDVRRLQADLAWLGLSSLGRAEAHVLVSLDRVLGILTLALGESLPDYDGTAPVGFRQGKALVEFHADELLGPARPDRRVRIVVTIPSEAAHDRDLCGGLVAAGMDVARINCAHDDPTAWRRMIDNLRAAAATRGSELRILMDLAGSKLRIDDLGGKKSVRLHREDRLTVADPGRLDTLDPGDDVVATCPVAKVFDEVALGDPVWFDDGRIGGHTEALGEGWFRVRIDHAKPTGARLRPNKGLNLPLTRLDLPAFQEGDREALDFAADHADAIALSFVQDPEDVVRLHDALVARRRPEVGIVLKIETRSGFEHLPRLLLAAMRHADYGVMIARGDLAVEMGFERLAEVQEEILWVAEAAHAPTIWATQVLERLSKRGAPSRAEVTDAAMSGRAEAVMLNKGEFIVDAIQSLDDILTRMDAHQDKKTPLLRPLGISRDL
ncbi:MAG: pyruvate kinase [Gemmatimonadetes bacterium]|nr:pyruvate kinase [Gemmatimonadota bacterium]MBT8405516.1 pyruvate kinase [Gemmatimonadota bacterium]NNK64904.1 pyruvate kinase [Gemmatimonadota bacterium]